MIKVKKKSVWKARETQISVSVLTNHLTPSLSLLWATPSICWDGKSGQISLTLSETYQLDENWPVAAGELTIKGLQYFILELPKWTLQADKRQSTAVMHVWVWINKTSSLLSCLLFFMSVFMPSLRWWILNTLCHAWNNLGRCVFL